MPQMESLTREDIVGVCCFLTPRSFYSFGVNDSAQVAIDWLVERLESMGFSTPYSKWNAVKTYLVGGSINGCSGWIDVRYQSEWRNFVESLGGKKFESLEAALDAIKQKFPEYPWKGVPSEILANTGISVNNDIYATILDETIWDSFLSRRLEEIRTNAMKSSPSMSFYEFHEGFRPRNGVHIMDFTDGLEGITRNNTVNRKWGILVKYWTHEAFPAG